MLLTLGPPPVHRLPPSYPPLICIVKKLALPLVYSRLPDEDVHVPTLLGVCGQTSSAGVHIRVVQ